MRYLKLTIAYDGTDFMAADAVVKATVQAKLFRCCGG